MLLLILAAAVASPICDKLAKDFESNERFMAFIHHSNSRLLEIAQESRRRLVPYEQAATIAGATVRADSSDDVRKAREALERDDEKYKREGDRITALMIDHDCRPPDHLTAWTTYAP